MGGGSGFDLRKPVHCRPHESIACLWGSAAELRASCVTLVSPTGPRRPIAVMGASTERYTSVDDAEIRAAMIVAVGDYP